MSHHKNGPNCPLCEEKIQTMHPTLAYWALLARTMRPDMHIAWGYRGPEDQEQFFNEGKTRCRYPNSAHNKTKDGKPCSEAFDCFRLRPDGVAEFREEWYRDLFQDLLYRAAPLEWAGNWHGFREFDHIQLAKGVPASDTPAKPGSPKA